jgi:hypothetical protein
MRRRALLGWTGALWVPGLAHAASEFEPWARRGSATMRFLGLRIYEIELWAPAPVPPERWAELPLGLELRYQRALKGRDIAERSLREMRRQAAVSDGDAAAWLAQMQQAFPDVQAGDRLGGRHEPGVGVQFYVNGQAGRRIEDAQFARLFFGIWLSPQTSEPALRQALLAIERA